MKRQVNKMAGTMRKTPRGAKGKVENPGKLFVRLMKYVFKDYLWQCILVFVLILTGVIANVQGTMFTKNLIDDYITPFLLTGFTGFWTFSPGNRQGSGLLCSGCDSNLSV